MRRKLGIALVLVAVIGLGLIFGFQRAIGQAIFERVSADRIAGNRMTLDDGLHVILCGTGSPLPNPDRAGPCNVIVAGDQSFVVDIGEGGARNLNLMGFDLAGVDGLFLTHYHSDHIDGVGPLALLRWTQGTATTPLPVYGPQGLEGVVNGFNEVYRLDKGYRVDHHGDAIVPESGGGLTAQMFDMGAEPQIVFERGALTVTAFRVTHNPIDPALGYRFDYKGRSVVISGDTSRSDELERVAKGADILVHDALQPKLVAALTAGLEKSGNDNVATITRDILDYHASPEEAAMSAEKASVDTLVLSHLVPPIPNSFFYPAFLGDAHDHFDGEIVVGEDGMIFSLTPNGDEVARDQHL